MKKLIEKTTVILDRIHGKGEGWTVTGMLALLVLSCFIPN
jgi:hypothetical protein